MLDTSKRYLATETQIDIITKLGVLLDRAPPLEVPFYKYGSYIASASASVSSIGLWHTGYVAWNIRKYSKGRFFTFLVAFASSFAGGVLYGIKVDRPLLSPYRSENKWYYGGQAVISNQLTLLFLAGPCLINTFLSAQMYGILPLANRFLDKEHRMDSLRFCLSALKPHSRKLIAINVLSSAFMFATGVMAYQDSRALLAKLGRRTISEKED